MFEPGVPSENSFVSGFVSLLGRPNAGKSTLLNSLTGEKLAIVSDKPQTTRTVVQGVWHSPEAQIVFLDTPGIHRSDTPFNKRMMAEVRSALDERDLLVYMVDATRDFEERDVQALDMVRKASTPAFLVLNKIDRVDDKGSLLTLIEKYRSALDFAEYVPVSALRRSGVEELRQLILKHLPEGPPYYESDHVTDQPSRFMAAEFIREKILRETRQEVPHSIAVMIDQWQDKRSLTRIAATVYVEREGQKAIIIGKQGAVLKKVGTLARKDIEQLLGGKVFLELFVKVSANWRENPEFLNQLNWRTMTGGEHA